MKPIKATAPRWAEYIAARRAHYQAKNAAQIRLREKHELERQGVAERQQAERADITAGTWRGKGDRLNALRSVLAAEQAAMRLRMQERQRDERRRFQERFRKDLRDFVAEIHGDRVAYHLAGQVSAAFVDRGDRIDVYNAADEAAILAALQLSAEREVGSVPSDRQRGLQGPLRPSGGPLWLHDHQLGTAG